MLPTIELPATESGTTGRPGTGEAGSRGRDGVFPRVFAQLLQGTAPAAAEAGNGDLPAVDGRALPSGGNSLPVLVDVVDAPPVAEAGSPVLTLPDEFGPLPADPEAVTRELPASLPPPTSDAQAEASLLPATPAAGERSPGSAAIALEEPPAPVEPARSPVPTAISAVSVTPWSAADADSRRPSASEASPRPGPWPAVRPEAVPLRPVPGDVVPPPPPTAEAFVRAAVQDAELLQDATAGERKLAQSSMLASMSATAASQASAPAPAAASSTAMPLPPAVADIRPPPGAPGWSETLGDRVLWLTGNQTRNAEIRLHPAEMGPLRVQVSVDDGTATVNFQAQHPLTREAIEQALPRLRDMLGEQGITLGDTSVTDQGVQDETRSPDQGMAGADGVDDAAGIADGSGLPAPRSVSRSLVDLYA